MFVWPSRARSNVAIPLKRRCWKKQRETCDCNKQYVKLKCCEDLGVTLGNVAAELADGAMYDVFCKRTHVTLHRILSPPIM